MSRGGSGNMLGVGGTRQHLGRKALRGGGGDGRIGGGLDAQAQKRELLRRLQERREQDRRQEQPRAHLPAPRLEQQQEGSEGGEEGGPGKRA